MHQRLDIKVIRMTEHSQPNEIEACLNGEDRYMQEEVVIVVNILKGLVSGCWVRMVKNKSLTNFSKMGEEQRTKQNTRKT